MIENPWILKYIFKNVDTNKGNFGASILYLFAIHKNMDVLIDISSSELSKCKKKNLLTKKKRFSFIRIIINVLILSIIKPLFSFLKFQNKQKISLIFFFFNFFSFPIFLPIQLMLILSDPTMHPLLYSLNTANYPATFI